jgi:putative heme-binding domain-containing protein
VRPVVLAVALSLAWAASPAYAQHETASDILDGGRAFQANCATCHGPDGDQIAGIDLGRGMFRRTLSDADLVGIIRNGIPNTPMPRSNLSEQQAGRIVAFLKSVAATKRSVASTGDAGRGKSVFEGTGRCSTCHRVDGTGSRLGPDLSTIGRLRRAVDLERSLLEPDAEVSPANRFYRVVTRDGTTTSGRLLNQDTFTIQLLDSKEQLRSFMKSDLREHGFAPTPMPSYRGTLAPQEVADVVSYLVSLKGRVTP